MGAGRVRWRRRGIAAISLMLASSVGAAASAMAEPPPSGVIRGAGSATAVPGSYIVKLKGVVASSDAARNALPQQAGELAGRYGGKVKHVYDRVLGGFSVEMSEKAARRLSADPAVSVVKQNHSTKLTAEQPNATWGLDRIDQRVRPMDLKYIYDTTAANVTVYVLDSGLYTGHVEFGTRASHGFDFWDMDEVAEDCNGHGTHVAGTIGGATSGVAKAVKLVGVRVTDCDGGGDAASLMAAVNWVTTQATKPGRPAGPVVGNMSIGTDADDLIDDAVRASSTAGVTWVASAGNAGVNACDRSPARVAAAITVGSTDSNDARGVPSNYGPCLDLFAPGEEIRSAGIASPTSLEVKSGTSMAAPHVAGAAALLLAANPGLTPEQVSDFLVANSTLGLVGNPGIGSPNRLLNTRSEMTGSSIAVARGGDERLSLLGINRHGHLQHRQQVAPNADTYTAWEVLNTGPLHSVAAEADPSGRVHAFALKRNGQLVHSWQTASGASTWTTWQPISGLLTSVAVTRAHDGKFRLFGTNDVGQIMHVDQANGDNDWGSWSEMAVPPSNDKPEKVAVETNADGRIELFIMLKRSPFEASSKMWRRWQTSATTDTWSAWTTTTDGSATITGHSVGAALNPSGQLEFFLSREKSHPLWNALIVHEWQQTAGSSALYGEHPSCCTWEENRNWGGYMGVAQPTCQTDSIFSARHLAVEAQENGLVVAFVVNPDGAVWQATKLSWAFRPMAPAGWHCNNTTWTAATALDGHVRP